MSKLRAVIVTFIVAMGELQSYVAGEMQMYSSHFSLFSLPQAVRQAEAATQPRTIDPSRFIKVSLVSGAGREGTERKCVNLDCGVERTYGDVKVVTFGDNGFGPLLAGRNAGDAARGVDLSPASGDGLLF